IGPLSAGTAGMTVSDTVTNLLNAVYATGIGDATATTLDASATVSVAQAEALHALPNFSRGSVTLTISDTAANVATLDSGTRALASSILTIGGGTSALTASGYAGTVDASGFSGSAASLTVSDS